MSDFYPGHDYDADPAGTDGTVTAGCCCGLLAMTSYPNAQAAQDAHDQHIAQVKATPTPIVGPTSMGPAS